MRYRRPQRSHTRTFVPYVTYTIAVLSVLLSAAYWLTGMKIGSFGQVPLEGIWGGDYGGLITQTFLHASPKRNPFHILFNLFWLLRLGPMVERSMGRLQYGVFLAGAAIAASCAEIAFTSDEAVGLSGVVYAIWGLCWAARRREVSFQLVSTRNTAFCMIGWLFFCVLLTKMGWMRVANGAHFGGLIFGVAIGWLFADPITVRRFRPYANGLLAALATVTVLSVAYLPWSARWRAWKTRSAYIATPIAVLPSASAPRTGGHTPL